MEATNGDSQKNLITRRREIAQRWAVNPKHSQRRRVNTGGAAINAAAVRQAEEEVAEPAGKL